MRAIEAFSGEYRWLSNFYPSDVVLDGLIYPSVEHAFQAAKTEDARDRRVVQKAPTPGAAKKLGRKVTLRSDWENAKQGVMLDLLRQKFGQGELHDLLLGTDDAQLVEGNWWGDRYWGVVDGMGSNHLGRLLMQVREELRIQRLKAEP